MSPEELTEATWQARYRWNRPSSVINRFFDTRTHLSSPAHAGTYLKYNPLYSKETFKKQAMRLGYFEDSIHPLRPGPLRCEALIGGALHG